MCVTPITFSVYCRPEPQGSSKAFVINGRARITSANAKMKPFRSEVTRCCLWEMAEHGWEAFGQHVPVRLEATFTFRKPASAGRKRTHCVVKPDLDKLLRCLADSLTGAAWHDDAQCVEMTARKLYGPVEGVEVRVEAVIEKAE